MPELIVAVTILSMIILLLIGFFLLVGLIIVVCEDFGVWFIEHWRDSEQQDGKGKVEP